MPNYTLAYFGVPQFDSEEDSQKEFEKFQAWLKGLGDAVVNPAMPIGAPVSVSASGVSEKNGSDRLTGFTIVKADNIDAAVEMAKACPYIQQGTIEVAEVMDMGM